MISLNCNPQHKRNNYFEPREGTEHFPIESVFRIFDLCDIGDKGR